MNKLNVAILGATGAVGQRFIQLLQDHPWFEISELVGKSSAGKQYGDAVNWILDDNPPPSIQELVVKPLDASLESQLVFFCLAQRSRFHTRTRAGKCRTCSLYQRISTSHG
jgi:aspartate-semialdehyde dehydrogenase